MTEQWGPWIEHDGKGCPCVGMLAQWDLDGGHEYVGMADKNGHLMIAPGIVEGIAVPGNAWSWAEGVIPIIRYRIRKPAALQTLIEIAADPAPLLEEAWK
jgi:hypothetical protein